MPLPSSINDLSQTAGSNSPSGSEAPSLIDDYLRTYASFIAQHRDGKGFALEASVASAATCDIGAANSLIVQITGTTGITSFGTTYSGPRIVRFAAALTLTHSASLVLPSAANITTAVDDFLIAVPNGNPASGWRVVSYHRATGTALVSPSFDLSTATGVLDIAKGGTGQTTASGAFGAIKQPASDAVSGVVELATAVEFNLGTDTARVPPVVVLRDNILVGIPAQSMAGNAIIEWLDIPSWVKRISLDFSAMSSSAASPISLRVGTSGGLVASGYSGSVQLVANTGVDSVTSTTGARVTTTADPASTHSGRFVVERLTNTNTWTITGVSSQSDTTRGAFVAVSISLASPLTRLAIYPDAGTFDSGSIGAIYE